MGAQEWFALNVFLRGGDEIYRTYFLQNGTMVSHIGSVNSLAALTPYGGQVEGEDVPGGGRRNRPRTGCVGTMSLMSRRRQRATEHRFTEC